MSQHAPEGALTQNLITLPEAARPLPAVQVFDRLLEDARSIEFEAAPFDNEEGYTHYMRRLGLRIGAVAVYPDPASPAEAEIELFDTNPANFHSGYLATAWQASRQYPEVVTIHGLNDPVFAVISAEIEDRVPGWYCQYDVYEDGISNRFYKFEDIAWQGLGRRRLAHSFEKLRPA
jgi:hypothetical protein